MDNEITGKDVLNASWEIVGEPGYGVRPMTPEERQALRERQFEANAKLANDLARKILNAENLQDFLNLRNKLDEIIKKATKCDHYDTRLPDDPRPFYEFDDFYFCPKCGEKL